MIDIVSTPNLEVRIVRLADNTHRLWINGPEGCLLRAYRIGHLDVNIDDTPTSPEVN